VKYKASLFYFIFIFSPDSPTEVIRGWIFTFDSSKHQLRRKEVPFWGHTMADNISNFPKTVKNGLL